MDKQNNHCEILKKKFLELESEREESQRKHKQAALENGDLKLRVQVLEGQLEEKAHLESLFAQVREELTRNRAAMKTEKEHMRQEVLDKEEELRKARVLAKEQMDKCEEWEERLREVEGEGHRAKLMWKEEADKGKKQKAREALLMKENREQHEKMEECQAEVRVTRFTKSRGGLEKWRS